MQTKLREHIEKIIPLTNDEFSFISEHFSTRKFKKHQFIIQNSIVNILCFPHHRK